MARLIRLLAQRRDDPRPAAVALPAREAAIDGLPRPVALRQIAPRCTGGQDPEHPVENGAMLAIVATLRLTRRQQRREARPGRIGEFVTVSHTSARQQQPLCSLAERHQRLSNTA